MQTARLSGVSGSVCWEDYAIYPEKAEGKYLWRAIRLCGKSMDLIRIWDGSQNNNRLGLSETYKKESCFAGFFLIYDIAYAIDLF